MSLLIEPSVALQEPPSVLLNKFSQKIDYPCYTIIADGDWTIYEAASHTDTFGSSPARDATLAWIRSGIKTDILGKQVFTHQLILSTGGDFTMAEERFLHHLPEDIKPAITLVTNAGARLFYYDTQQLLKEDSYYTSHSIDGGVCINSEIEKQFVHNAVDLLNIFFSYLKHSPQLQKEVQEAPYGQWVQKFADQYPENGFTLEEFQEQSRVMHGIYKSLEMCPRIEIREIDRGQTVQISIVGMFSNLPALKEHVQFQKCLTKLAECPSVILSQNLCVLEISRTNKGTALHYLNINPEFSLGMGDSPEGNDKPLSEYIAQTAQGYLEKMPFISVSDKPAIEADRFYNVGHKVVGAKHFFESLIQEQNVHPKQLFLETVQKAQAQANQVFAQKS